MARLKKTTTKKTAAARGRKPAAAKAKTGGIKMLSATGKAAPSTANASTE